MSSSTIHHTMVYLKNEDYENIRKSALQLGLSISKYIGLATLGRISKDGLLLVQNFEEVPKQ